MIFQFKNSHRVGSLYGYQEACLMDLQDTYRVAKTMAFEYECENMMTALDFLLH